MNETLKSNYYALLIAITKGKTAKESLLAMQDIKRIDVMVDMKYGKRLLRKAYLFQFTKKKLMVEWHGG